MLGSIGGYSIVGDTSLYASSGLVTDGMVGGGSPAGWDVSGIGVSCRGMVATASDCVELSLRSLVEDLDVSADGVTPPEELLGTSCPK